MTLEAGQRVLDRYIVEEPLGQGGMGAVFRARHERLGHPIALKTMRTDDPGLRARFEREAQLMARVRHPGVVGILDYGTVEGDELCIAMELVEGAPLHHVMRAAAVPWRKALWITRGILAGLEAVHAAGIIHRDLKPANVIVAPGPPEMVKVLDFGIARVVEDDAGRLTKTGLIVGTPTYMAPEQLAGLPVDERTDVYAAALVLYELLDGEVPFGRDTQGPLRRLREVCPRPRLRDAPEAVADVVMRALHVDSTWRPNSARAFSELLDRAEHSAGSEASEPTSTGFQALPPASSSWGAATKQLGTALTPPTQPLVGLVPETAPMPGPPPSSLSSRAATEGIVGPSPWGDRTPPSRAEAPHAATLQWAGSPSAGAGTAAPSLEPPAQPAPLVSAPMPQAVGHAPRASDVGKRAVVAAALPPSLLARPDERRFLASTIGTGARSFTFGAQFWFSLVRAPTGDELRHLTETIIASLRDRYGSACRASAVDVDSSFRLTPSALTGAAPLPLPLAELLEGLT